MIRANRWVHLTGVYDLKQVSLFVDGKLQDTDAVRGKHNPAVLPFIVGGDPMAVAPNGVLAGNFFHGTVKAVRISEGALYAQSFDPPKQLGIDRQGCWNRA